MGERLGMGLADSDASMRTSSRPLDELPPIAAGSTDLQVIIETPKGTRNKYKYDEESGLFKLHKVLPAGAVFPFDFGFLPSTRGEDGDPLDMLLLLDEPVFTGCLVPTRLLGVIEAEQTSEEGTERNDRLIGVAACSRDHAEDRSLKEVGDGLLQQIEHFFASYNAFDGKKFKVLGRHDAQHAHKLIEQGIAAFKHG
jgi:inorganic pyrophosphatase